MDHDEFQLLYDEMKECRAEITAIKVDLAGLKGRASVWGLIAGGIVSAIISYFNR